MSTAAETIAKEIVSSNWTDRRRLGGFGWSVVFSLPGLVVEDVPVIDHRRCGISASCSKIADGGADGLILQLEVFLSLDLRGVCGRSLAVCVISSGAPFPDELTGVGAPASELGF